MSPNFLITEAVLRRKLMVVAVIAITGKSSKTADVTVNGFAKRVKVRI